MLKFCSSLIAVSNMFMNQLIEDKNFGFILRTCRVFLSPNPSI